ncbi:hypothetical protein EDC01DRAFT_628449 [Geopyxis carbonaria]|nr:hypothetical protein EDC01DRAFT_628449 [Geopyxis carbonaria]
MIFRTIIHNPGLAVRSFTTTVRLSAALGPRPSPPQLPKEQQAEFERLQKQSTGAFQTSHLVNAGDMSKVEEAIEHKDLRKGAKPEFEGDKNPKTGEVGGPKNDPLRHNEWTYNGRATDF